MFQSRRKDSLRQFVVTLFERKQLRQLASYPYIDMLEDFVQIIEGRARFVLYCSRKSNLFGML